MANYFEDDVRIVIAPRMAVGPQGANAPEVQVQYSSDGSSWHDTPQSGDMYLRFSTDDGNTWGEAVRLAEMAIDDQIVDNVTDRAPSQNAVYDALTQKVTGPASSTDGGIAVFSGTDGKLLKDFGYLPRRSLTGDITVTVGSGGDYTTINAALEDIVSKYYPVYLSGGNCPRVTINLLSGFVMSEQVLVESLDLSWIMITGDDAETVINRSALTTEFEGRYPVFGVAKRGCLPVIGQLFNMDSSGDGTNRDGIYVCNNSYAIIENGAGIKNVGANGISAIDNSSIQAYGAIVSGAGNYGVYAYRGGRINARSIDASGAGAHGIVASSNAFVEAFTANVSGAENYGVNCYAGSIVNAVDVDASGTGNYGLRVYVGGIIAANGVTGTLSQSANTLTASGIIFK